LVENALRSGRSGLSERDLHGLEKPLKQESIIEHTICPEVKTYPVPPTCQFGVPKGQSPLVIEQFVGSNGVENKLGVSVTNDPVFNETAETLNVVRLEARRKGVYATAESVRSLWSKR
jgi:hypothetical protein